MKDHSVGFTGLLFIVFLVLKLTHTIDWSWWWVTAPLWIPIVIAVVTMVVVVPCAILIGKYFRNKE